MREGEKSYEYGWLDKAIRVTENGRELAKFEYRNNGQLARAMRGNDIETFEWDGFALIERNGVKYINEPHTGGGNPILATTPAPNANSLTSPSQSQTIFTDMLGTSIGYVKDGKYSDITKTSFGVDTSDKSSFFTGKPYVKELGYAFLFRNYRPDMGKWQISDIIGYPDGWNNSSYCGNSVITNIDLFGCVTINSFFEALDFYSKNTNPNANATIGNGVLNEFFSTDTYTFYYNVIKSQAESVSLSETSGQIDSAKSVSWSQGLVWVELLQKQQIN